MFIRIPPISFEEPHYNVYHECQNCGHKWVIEEVTKDDEEFADELVCPECGIETCSIVEHKELCPDCLVELRYNMMDMDGTNLEEVYSCPNWPQCDFWMFA
jgi:hypothetical protein